MRGEAARLAFETENGAVDVRLFLREHAGVVREIARGEIVRAVDDDVVRANDVESVLAGETRIVKDHIDVRIEGVDGFPGGLRFGAANVGIGVENLTLQIRIIHHVEIRDAEFTDARGGEIQRDGRAQSARADAKNAGRAQLFLPGHADLGQNQMPRVAADFVVVQVHIVREDKLHSPQSSVHSPQLERSLATMLTRNNVLNMKRKRVLVLVDFGNTGSNKFFARRLTN